MSTPTTATATLPPHYRHPHQHHPPSHLHPHPHPHPHPHQHHHHYPQYQPLPANSASYRAVAPGQAPVLPALSPASSTASVATIPNRQSQHRYLPSAAASVSSYATTSNSSYIASEVLSNGGMPSLAPARHVSTRTHSTPQSETQQSQPSQPSQQAQQIQQVQQVHQTQQVHQAQHIQHVHHLPQTQQQVLAQHHQAGSQPQHQHQHAQHAQLSLQSLPSLHSLQTQVQPTQPTPQTQPPQPLQPTLPAQPAHLVNMPATAQPCSDSQPRKRRRSKEPDWKQFYKNGLPKEIIVIDDTPEPEHGSTASTSMTYTNDAMNGPANNQAARHCAKKRKKEDEQCNFDTKPNMSAYQQPSTGSVSTDRTTSALNTTAPTSLSSNGQFDIDPSQAGQKRKRTRQQLAQDAKRREFEALGEGFLEYQPPPKPIKKCAEVTVRPVTDRSHQPGTKVDGDDGHYIVVPDADLTTQYQIRKLLGQGTFGKVIEARDRKCNKLVAIKIIRAVQKYRDASRIELRVLQTLKANDEKNRNRCIHLRDCFDFRGHICIVMDLLGPSVFDFLKSNNFVPFPNSQIQSFARQLLTSVAFLHDLNLIHTDLKPENILLCDGAYQTFTYNRRIPSATNGTCRQATQRKVLLDTEIRLIDFGSATFDDEYHSSVVSTRHYRAPEIILGLGWSFPCDIWSIGCILVEFFTGDALFQTHDNLEHLAMMENVCDSRIDTHLVQAVNRSAARNSSTSPAKYFKRLKLDYPTPETTRASRRFVRNMKRLSEIVPATSSFLKQFLDLLQKIFVYDPSKRITARQALAHPWFREAAIADDGTEALKIRLERMRENADHHTSRVPLAA